MIRVLLIVAALDGGGIENMLLNYILFLPRNKYKFDIIVHSPAIGKLESSFKNNGCKIIRVPSKRANLYKNISQIHRIIKYGNYNVIHSNMSDQSFTHMISGWIYKIPIRIIHTHVATNNRNRVLSFLLVQIATKFANRYVACSRKAALSFYGKKNVNENRVIILRNAIDCEKFEFSIEKRKQKRTELGVDDKFVIGIVGRLSEEKNYSFSLECFNSLLRKAPDSVLLIIGDGSLKESITIQIKDLGLESKVYMLGIRDDVPILLQAMDAFMLPSKTEGLGMSYIEAQCTGLPCLASNHVPKETAITDLIQYLPIESGVDIWVDALLAIKTSKIRNREQYVNNCIAAGYDIRDQVEKLDNIYSGREVN